MNYNGQTCFMFHVHEGCLKSRKFPIGKFKQGWMTPGDGKGTW